MADFKAENALFLTVLTKMAVLSRKWPFWPSLVQNPSLGPRKWPKSSKCVKMCQNSSILARIHVKTRVKWHFCAKMAHFEPKWHFLTKGQAPAPLKVRFCEKCKNYLSPCTKSHQFDDLLSEDHPARTPSQDTQPASQPQRPKPRAKGVPKGCPKGCPKGVPKAKIHCILRVFRPFSDLRDLRDLYRLRS